MRYVRLSHLFADFGPTSQCSDPESGQVNSNLYCIVLAAGEAKRFGSPKQLAEYGGKTLVARAVRLAESVCGEKYVLVVGAYWQQTVASSLPIKGFFVTNPKFKSGLSGSIRRGVQSVEHIADGVLVILADQPLITTEHLKSMHQAWLDEPSGIVATRYNGTIGVPAILPAHFFTDLKQLHGDRGARHILQAHSECVTCIDLPAAASDIDLVSDLQRLP